jgi:hypothetical protein
VNLAIASVLGLYVFSLVVPAPVFAADKFSAEILLKENENKVTDVTEYEPSSVILNQNEFCPTANCQYRILDGRLTHNSYDSAYRHFQGTLEVTKQEGGAKAINLYPFESDLSISETRKIGDHMVEILDGEISFGRGSPDFMYHIKNGTLTSDGSKTTLLLSGNYT